MVAAPTHARHGKALECDTCEDDRRAARALFIPPEDDPQVLEWRQNEVARAVDAVTTALGQLGAKPIEPGPA
jgi:hypothetical protein